MAATIEITINGLAMLIPNSSARKWRVLFPFDIPVNNGDDCHNVKLTFSAAGYEGDLAKKGRVVEIDLQNVVSGYQDWSDYGEALNLDDEKAHGRPNVGNGKGIERRYNAANAKHLELVMPEASFASEDLSRDHFVLLEPEGNDYVVKMEPTQIAKSVTAIVKADPGYLKVKISDVQIQPVSLVDGNTYTLTFDNDCYDANRTKNDFQMLYKHLIREKGGNRQFELEWVPNIAIPYLDRNDRIGKSWFKLIQLLGRELYRKEGLLPVAADPTYPCFVSGGKGDD